jgi:cytochrome c7-like protein
VSEPIANTTQPNARRLRWGAAALPVLTVLLVVATWVGAHYWYPSRLGPQQPIPFSHRVHVTDKKISCLICHPGVVSTARATVPPLETCLLCHDRIIVKHPQIVKLRRHNDKGIPVEWERVSALPDYVYFNHAAHIRKGVDCGKCHGDVAGMDRMWLANEFTMGYCVQCHRDEKASVDCLTCHR